MKKIIITISLFYLIFNFNFASEDLDKKQLEKKYSGIMKDGTRAIDHQDPQMILMIMGNIKQFLGELQIIKKSDNNISSKEIKKMEKNLYIMRETLDGLAAPSEKPKNSKTKKKEV